MKPWEHKEGEGDFGPRKNIGGVVYPTPLDDLASQVTELWADVVSRCTSTAPIARLNHLLFEKNSGHGGERLRNAAKAYSELSVGTWDRFTRAKLAAWSHELYRRLRDTSSAEGILHIAAQHARESMLQEKREPGVALLAIEVIVQGDPTFTELDALLTEARTVYAGDWHIEGAVLQLRLRAKIDDAVTQAELRRARVQILLDHAATLEPGAVQMGFLEDAARLAHSLGISDLKSQATARLQLINREDLGLVRFETKMEIPIEVIDGPVEGLLGGWCQTGFS